MSGILEGVRVLDFGRYIAGPYCASLLADLGADVIRIEQRGGGDDRYFAPATHHGEGAQYLQCNMGKRCLSLDLRSKDGREVMRRLISQADVVVANFSPGALKHFGLDYETLRKIKDDIILTTASAYHSEGPLAERIGFDGVGQAVSGAIWLTGLPGQPFRSATAYVDFSTALSCAYGTLAAIIAKMKTGKGTHVQASLVGTALTVMNQILIEQATGFNSRIATGNRSPVSGPSDIFSADDGPFVMQVIGNKMFQRWTEIVGRPELAKDERFATDMLRGENGVELSAVMAEWCKGRTREECLSVLVASNIGCGPVLSPAEVAEGDMGLLETFMDKVPFPGSDGIFVTHAPAQLSNGQTDMSRPPLLGEHNDEVLAEFGFSNDEIAELRSASVI